MNQRNIEALTRCFDALPDCCCCAPAKIAAALAAQGVLGPASKVLTDDDEDRLFEGQSFGYLVEEIAKGEA